MQAKGKVTNWNDERGFGFITPLGGQEQVFFHISVWPRGKRPALNQIVCYELEQDLRGRPRAASIRLTGRDRAPELRLSAGNRAALWAFAIAAAFLFAVAYGAAWRFYPYWLFWLYLGMSVVTYLMYYFDKRAARLDDQRTPENTLHMAALFGGWPGALFAQQQLRHKSVKSSFQFEFWITVIVNLAAFAYLLKQLRVW